MKKTVKVSGHIRPDGTVVDAHVRSIDSNEPNSLTKEIKQRKLDEDKANLLTSLFEEN
jgi:hypothetical protein